MLSIQYLNKRLKKSHIEKILANYTIKYTTMKKEIDSKIDAMIKTFTQDISGFLDNVEEVAEEKEKIKSFEQNKNELETLREQVKDKIHEQTKLRREVELLKIENNRLKAISNNNNNNTIYSSRKKMFSPPHRDNNNHQALNTISNFDRQSLNSPLKKQKDVKSLILNSDRKEKKEIKDSKLFKSPQASTMRDNKKKIKESNENENKSKKLGESKKKEKKNNNNLLSFSSEANLEPKKKNSLFGSAKNLINKNKRINDTPKNKNNEINKKNDIKKGENIKNKNINNTSKNKQMPKSLTKQEYLRKKDKKKESEENSFEKETFTNNDENNESKSKITTEDYEEEQTYIDQEINEMNDFEEEILSLIGHINEFKQENNNNNLT